MWADWSRFKGCRVYVNSESIINLWLSHGEMCFLSEYCLLLHSNCGYWHLWLCLLWVWRYAGMSEQIMCGGSSVHTELGRNSNVE